MEHESFDEIERNAIARAALMDAALAYAERAGGVPARGRREAAAHRQRLQGCLERSRADPRVVDAVARRQHRPADQRGQRYQCARRRREGRGRGEETLAALLERAGCSLASYAQARTWSGGRHIFFAYKRAGATGR